MITSMHIENFKCFKDFDIELGPFNVLIGPNASGKSNLLALLEIISASARGELRDHVLSAGGMHSIAWDGTGEPVEVALEVDPSERGQTDSGLFTHHRFALSRIADTGAHCVSAEETRLVPAKGEDDAYVRHRPEGGIPFGPLLGGNAGHYQQET